MHKTFGEEFQDFDKLPSARRLEIMEAQNEITNRHFTTDDDAKVRAEAPDLYFRRGQPDSWLGQANGPKNLIELNNTAPDNSPFSDSLGGGLAGTNIHEFAHIQQHRQAQRPNEYIWTRFGRMSAKELQNIHQPGTTQEEFDRYYDQLTERDARKWDWTYKNALERSPNKPDPAIREAFSDQPTVDLPAIDPVKPGGQASVSRHTPPLALTPLEGKPFSAVTDEEIGALVGGLEGNAKSGNFTELPSSILHDAEQPHGSRLRAEDLFSPELLPADHPSAKPMDEVWEPSSLPSKPLLGTGTNLTPGIVQNVGDAVSNALIGAQDWVNRVRPHSQTQDHQTHDQVKEHAATSESDNETAARFLEKYMARADLTHEELSDISSYPEPGAQSPTPKVSVAREPSPDSLRARRRGNR
jgi:hypothetical protein